MKQSTQGHFPWGHTYRSLLDTQWVYKRVGSVNFVGENLELFSNDTNIQLFVSVVAKDMSKELWTQTSQEHVAVSNCEWTSAPVGSLK